MWQTVFTCAFQDRGLIRSHFVDLLSVVSSATESESVLERPRRVGALMERAVRSSSKCCLALLSRSSVSSESSPPSSHSDRVSRLAEIPELGDSRDPRMVSS